MEYMDHSCLVPFIALHPFLSGARRIQQSLMQTAVFFLSTDSRTLRSPMGTMVKAIFTIDF